MKVAMPQGCHAEHSLLHSRRFLRFGTNVVVTVWLQLLVEASALWRRSHGRIKLLLGIELWPPSLEWNPYGLLNCQCEFAALDKDICIGRQCRDGCELGFPNSGSGLRDCGRGAGILI